MTQDDTGYYGFTPYPEKIQKIRHALDFIALVWYLESHFGCTTAAAYEKAEEIYEHYYGGRKYSDYTTFLVIRSKHLKKS